MGFVVIDGELVHTSRRGDDMQDDSHVLLQLAGIHPSGLDDLRGLCEWLNAKTGRTFSVKLEDDVFTLSVEGDLPGDCSVRDDGVIIGRWYVGDNVVKTGSLVNLSQDFSGEYIDGEPKR